MQKIRKFWAQIWDLPECIKSLTVACKAYKAPLIDVFSKAEAHKLYGYLLGTQELPLI